jgi:apolipoprotein N-acyltransferase
MLVPAWDFNLDRTWHGHIAVKRGVEDGFGVSRAAKDGFLTVSNNRRKILEETRSDTWHRTSIFSPARSAVT